MSISMFLELMADLEDKQGLGDLRALSLSKGWSNASSQLILLFYSISRHFKMKSFDTALTDEWKEGFLE